MLDMVTHGLDVEPAEGAGLECRQGRIVVDVPEAKCWVGTGGSRRYIVKGAEGGYRVTGHSHMVDHSPVEDAGPQGCQRVVIKKPVGKSSMHGSGPQVGRKGRCVMQLGRIQDIVVCGSSL